MNKEAMSVMLQFALISLGLLATVFLIALITPKLAKLVNRHIKPKENNPNDRSGDVSSPFEDSGDDEYDLNAKIYTDIYALPTKKHPRSDENKNSK